MSKSRASRDKQKSKRSREGAKSRIVQSDNSATAFHDLMISAVQTVVSGCQPPPALVSASLCGILFDMYERGFEMKDSPLEERLMRRGLGGQVVALAMKIVECLKRDNIHMQDKLNELKKLLNEEKPDEPANIL